MVVAKHKFFTVLNPCVEPPGVYVDRMLTVTLVQKSLGSMLFIILV